MAKDITSADKKKAIEAAMQQIEKTYGKGTIMTDAEVVRAVYDLVDDNCHNLIYCEDAKYMDIGHNENLFDISFIAHMPNLEAIILSGSSVKKLGEKGTFAWWTVLIFDWDAKQSCFVLKESNTNASNVDKSQMEIPENGFAYCICVGNDYSSSGGINYVTDRIKKSNEYARSLKVGDKAYLYGTLDVTCDWAQADMPYPADELIGWLCEIMPECLKTYCM